ncbi:MAG TPA: hydrogen gas-evolving membrane-bound hydrogenase subunit E [Nitrospiria bacterium]|jgi:multicomponent Na+:H+ antiporter subunit B
MKPSIENPQGQQNTHQRRKRVFNFISFLIVFITGGVLIYGTLDMPGFGDPHAPANLHVAPRYIEKIIEETGVENMVTGILASYRGYDTLGETVVIFTAGLSVILLLRRTSRDG